LEEGENYVEPLLVIGIIGGLILLVLVVGTPIKPLRFAGQTIIKVMIGALFLFFLNAFGNSMGIHVPINAVTSAISGLLGIPGVVALVIIQMYII
jgi:inhibitor of the pro-sigma K processing machinery